MHTRCTIVGLGEALFDVFPDHQVLGGAPLNVAVHAHQLVGPVGGRGILVGRIGQDSLGQQILDELSARKMTPMYVQQDPEHCTGRVEVTIVDGEPNYVIKPNVAWDHFEFTTDCANLAGRCNAICFGTLAQRTLGARRSISLFLQAARQAIRLFDVNLRQSFYDRDILEESCNLATVIKLNEHELPIVADLLGLDRATDQDVTNQRATELLNYFELQAVALTRGPKGTVLYTRKGRFETAPVKCNPDEGADAVGAGDACSAGLLAGMLLDMSIEQTLDLANQAGAFVASKRGATPILPEEIRNIVAQAVAGPAT